MRICFIADSSSIHVKRIVSHCVRKKDDVLVLSSALHRSELPGTRTVHLHNTNISSFAGRRKDGKRPTGLIPLLKSFIPVSLIIFVRRTIRGLQLVRKREFCVKEIQNCDPDVIYCFRSFPEGVLASYSHVRPLLLRTAGPDISKLPKYPLYRQIIRKALRTADVVVTESLVERELLRKMCGAEVDPKVIIIGIDSNLFRPPHSRDSVRDKYGLPRDAFVVVSNRNLEGDKNGWLVVKAVQSIVEQCPNLVLFYATPHEMSRRVKAEIEEIAPRFPQIKLLEGPVPHSEVPDILGCGDVYVSFSSFDGIPNSVLEAMACGVVPVVAELAQLHEWIEQGVTGYFVPQYDTKGLASVLCDLYKDRQVLPDMSARCVSKIGEQGSYEECMERTRDLLKYLVQADSGVKGLYK